MSMERSAGDPAGRAPPWTGGCRCGAVRLEATAAPVMAVACHCKGCRRMTGGAYSLSLMLPEAGFRLTAGETVRAGLGAALEDGRALGSGENPDLAAALDHRACPVCKSWMFTRIAMLRDMVNLRAAMLDRDAWVTPFVETCRAEAQPGVVTGARHAFDGFPDAAAWPGLMAAYAREGARP